MSAGVPFFFKQWGEWLAERIYDDSGEYISRDPLEVGETQLTGNDFDGFDGKAWVFKGVGKHRAGRILDGRTWDEFPEDRR